ncbi:MAG: ammonia channel protein, partial [bacterium]|nr:ammonia channel protein [bacterium]
MKKILMILTILTGLFATGWLLAEEPAATPAVCGVAAEPAPAAINTGDTAWILMSTALVMMMTAPGLAMFYGGLVRRKNVLSTMMQSFFLLGLISV